LPLGGPQTKYIFTNLEESTGPESQGKTEEEEKTGTPQPKRQSLKVQPEAQARPDEEGTGSSLPDLPGQEQPGLTSR